MHNDGKTYLWIPTCLSLSTMDAQAVAIMNAVHTAIGRPLVTTASQNPYIMQLNDLDMGGAPFTRDCQPGMACCGPIENLGYLSLDYVSLIVAFGGDIEGLPVWFELDNITAQCPFDPLPPKKTWATWGTFGESHKPVRIGDKWYRSNAVGESGDLLLASRWVALRSSGLLTVLTKSEFQAVQAANQQPI
jgi:hypothetical protein